MTIERLIHGMLGELRLQRAVVPAMQAAIEDGDPAAAHKSADVLLERMDDTIERLKTLEADMVETKEE